MEEDTNFTIDDKADEEKKQPGKKKRTHSNFNFWAAFFGPFYYIYEGLWKKGLLLSSLAMILIMLVHLLFPRISISALSTGISVGVFGTMANIDLARKEESGETMWKELPAIFHQNWLVVILFVLTFIVYMATPMTSLSEIEDTSTGLVTEILHDHYGIPLEAVNVRIVEEVKSLENFYHAEAKLSNDSSVEVLIEYFPDDYYIEVFIPDEEILYLIGDI